MTAGQDDDDELDRSVVRPFILTGGRTQPTVPVVMESLIDRLDLAGDEHRRLDAVHRDIWDLVGDTLSAAEISAMLKLPLGVVLVVLSDMAEQGLVVVHETAALNDLQLVRRLIDGVEAL